MAQAIHISPIDNVVVALHPIAKGELVQTDGLSVTALEDIPQGHKMAVQPIKAGENVIKYGFPIGHATEDAALRMRDELAKLNAPDRLSEAITPLIQQTQRNRKQQGYNIESFIKQLNSLSNADLLKQ